MNNEALNIVLEAAKQLLREEDTLEEVYRSVDVDELANAIVEVEGNA